MYEKRLGLTFHRTFPFMRQAVSEIINAFENGGKTTPDMSRVNLNKETSLGSIYIEAMPRYALGAGLLDKINRISIFGQCVVLFDHLMTHQSTQWLIHYHLSAPLGPGPLFWHELVSTRFRSGDEFTTQEIAERIGEIYKREEGKPLADRSARSTATIFTGTYTHSDGLGNLGLLKEISPGRFQVLDPDPPPTWVIGFALLHWWRSLYPNQATINLNDFYGSKGITQLLMIGKGKLNSVLDEMQDEGFLQTYRIAPPYQVVLFRDDEEAILRKIYGN